MTVERLIEVLKKFPRDSEVFIAQTESVLERVADSEVFIARDHCEIQKVSYVCDLIIANHWGVMLDSHRLARVSTPAPITTIGS